ncbi:MAG: putative exonuclease/polymerase [Candidatus Tokpelaia sp. JSC085]|nr:MAG: putative exonuclease/polymerase [Candidatus Tokpelaia sp. JSC085]
MNIVNTVMSRLYSEYYPEIKSSHPKICAFNERAAINASIKSAAADIIRRAMIRLDEKLKNAGLSAVMAGSR